MKDAGKDQRDFLILVKIGSALGLGLMSAFIYSLKAVHPELRFEFGYGTGVAFILAAVFAWLVCGLISIRRAQNDQRFAFRWLLFFGGLTLLATGFGFARALRGFAWADLRDVVEGTLMAVVLLSIVGILIWRIVRYFERASEPEAPIESIDPDEEP